MAIFNDPIGWSRSAVATWPRFVFCAVIGVALPFALVYVASTGGWSTAIGLATYLAASELMSLYAMRRLLQFATHPEKSIESVA